MPRFKTPDYGLKMIPVDFAQQVLPGTFEFALCHLVDHVLDLSTLRSRYTNDAGGAPAFDPAVRLKIVLLAHTGAERDCVPCAVCRASSVPAHAGQDQGKTGRVLPRQARWR
jgi:hypothetical protein